MVMVYHMGMFYPGVFLGQFKIGLYGPQLKNRWNSKSQLWIRAKIEGLTKKVKRAGNRKHGVLNSRPEFFIVQLHRVPYLLRTSGELRRKSHPFRLYFDLWKIWETWAKYVKVDIRTWSGNKKSFPKLKRQKMPVTMSWCLKPLMRIDSRKG